MRWSILILNLLAAVAFVVIASMFTAAHRTHAYSTYRELVHHRALMEKPTYTDGQPYDVERRIANLGNGGALSFVGYLAAGACVLNGFVFFFSHQQKR
jgi:hypothetical protein